VLINALTGGGDRVEMSGAAMRLAMMGGLFATLIVAVPPLIMQLFNASIGYASNLMGSMGLARPMQTPGAQGAGGFQGGYGAGAAGGHPSAFPVLAHSGAAQVGGGQAVRDASSNSVAGQGVHNAYAAVTRANVAARESDVAAVPSQPMAGRIGVASGSGQESVYAIQRQQESPAFRNNTSGGRMDSAQGNPVTGIEDASVRREYVNAGTGGALNVQGGIKGEPLVEVASVSARSYASTPGGAPVTRGPDRPGVPEALHTRAHSA
jgi:hypothetical protein